MIPPRVTQQAASRQARHLKRSRTTGFAQSAAHQRPISSPSTAELRRFPSPEQALHLLHERRLLGVDVLTEILRESSDQLLLRGGELGWHLDSDLHELIPSSARDALGNALALDAEDRSRLCPRGNPHLSFAFER